MLIVTLYTKMSEYTQNTIVINSPMSLSFHILHSHFIRSGGSRLCSAIVINVFQKYDVEKHVKSTEFAAILPLCLGIEAARRRSKDLQLFQYKIISFFRWF